MSCWGLSRSDTTFKWSKFLLKFAFCYPSSTEWRPSICIYWPIQTVLTWYWIAWTLKQAFEIIHVEILLKVVGVLISLYLYSTSGECKVSTGYRATIVIFDGHMPGWKKLELFFKCPLLFHSTVSWKPRALLLWDRLEDCLASVASLTTKTKPTLLEEITDRTPYWWNGMGQWVKERAHCLVL